MDLRALIALTGACRSLTNPDPPIGPGIACGDVRLALLAITRSANSRICVERGEQGLVR